MRRIRVFLITISAVWAFSDVVDTPFRLTTAMAQSSKSQMPLAFDIPAQALATALATYGAATGLDVFYDADLAEKQRSTDVSGMFSPAQALDMLLLGTGYVARTTGPGAFTILRAPRMETPDLASPIDPRLYGSYFATIQARVSDALCGFSGIDSRPDEILFRFWLAPSGTVVRAEVICRQRRSRRRSKPGRSDSRPCNWRPAGRDASTGQPGDPSAIHIVKLVPFVAGEALSH